MATITLLNSTDSGATSRTVINTNFTNLNTNKLEVSGAFTAGNIPLLGTTGLITDSGKVLPSSALVGLTDTQALTNKSVNGVTLSTVAGTGVFLRGDGTYAATTSAQASYSQLGVVQFLIDAATSGITVSAGVANVNTGTGANQIVKLDGSAKLPAVDGSQLTGVPSSDYISSATNSQLANNTASYSFTLTAPTNAKFAVCVVDVNSIQSGGAVATFSYTINVYKTGATTVKAPIQSNGQALSSTISWASNTITVSGTCFTGATSFTGASATLYFYK